MGRIKRSFSLFLFNETLKVSRHSFTRYHYSSNFRHYYSPIPAIIAFPLAISATITVYSASMPPCSFEQRYLRRENNWQKEERKEKEIPCRNSRTGIFYASFKFRTNEFLLTTRFVRANKLKIKIKKKERGKREHSDKLKKKKRNKENIRRKIFHVAIPDISLIYYSQFSLRFKLDKSRRYVALASIWQEISVIGPEMNVHQDNDSKNLINNPRRSNEGSNWPQISFRFSAEKKSKMLFNSSFDEFSWKKKRNLRKIRER